MHLLEHWKVVLVLPEKKRSLAETHPEIAKEADGWDPSDVSTKSGRSLSWRCSLGHTWNGRVADRTRGEGTRCPYCSNKKFLQGFNDLATTHPSLAREADGWDPRAPQLDLQILSWRCLKGHIWTARLKDRKQGVGCHICLNYGVHLGHNDLASVSPTLAKELVEGDSSKISAGSHKKLSWKCKNGHYWRATPKDRIADQSGCPFCSDRKVLTGYNDLKTKFPAIANEAFNFDPSGIIWNSHKTLEWKCSLGHIWKALVFSRTKINTGCPFCTNRRILVGFNDLGTTHPKLVLELVKRDQGIVTAGSARKVEWICEKGHTWKARVAHRALSHSGCPTCTPGGFNPEKDGWLYFLDHPAWKLLQIGITNRPENRLRTHSNLGWEVVEICGPMDGYSVQRWETTILRYVKKQGGQFANKIGLEPFDGYSESWLKESFTFESLKEIMDQIDEDEINEEFR